MGLKSQQHPDCNNGGFKYQEREKLHGGQRAWLSEKRGQPESGIQRGRTWRGRGCAEGVTVRDVKRATVKRAAASEMEVGGLQKTRLRQKETSQAQETQKKRTRGSLVKLEAEDTAGNKRTRERF